MSTPDNESGPEEVAAANAEIAERLRPFEKFFDENTDRRWVEVSSGKGELLVGEYDSGDMVLTEGSGDFADLYRGKIYIFEGGELVHYAPTPAPDMSVKFTEILQAEDVEVESDEGVELKVERNQPPDDATLTDLLEPYEKFLREHPEQQRIRVGLNLVLEIGSETYGNPNKLYLLHAGSEDPEDHYWLDAHGALVGVDVQPAPNKAVRFAEILKEGESELDPLPAEEAEAAYREVSEQFDEKKPSGENQKVVVERGFGGGHLELLRDDSTGMRVIVDMGERAEGKPGIYVLRDGELFSRDDLMNEEPASRKAAELAQALKTGTRKTI